MKFISFFLLVSNFAFGDLFENSRQLELRALAEGWTYEAPDHAFHTGFRGHRNGKRAAHSYVEMDKADVEIPDEYDPRDKLGPIRNQGQCGSCWSFSIIASLRDALMTKGIKDPGALSEQYLVDCARDMLGCGGGLPSAAAWITIPKGAPLLSDYPYMARNGRCMSKPVAGQALEWHYVGQSGRIPLVADIQKAIMIYSSASVTIAADNALAGYRGGVFRGSSRQINHMTNIVGWSKAGGYWIMRNSWGQGWGEQGWGKIAFGANSIGTDTIVMSVTTRPPAPPIPVIREFEIEGIFIKVKMTIDPANPLKTEDVQLMVKKSVEDLDARSK